MQSEIIEVEDLEIEKSFSKPKQEYEKIMIKERNRKLNIKARDLVKLGCFEQKDVEKIDFSKLEKVTYDKQYKKLYDLYLDLEGNLLYVYAKTEGESEIPFGFDVIYLENVTEEIYEEIVGVAKYRKAGLIKTCYIASLVILILATFIILVNFIYSLVAGSTFLSVLIDALGYLMSLGLLAAMTGVACAQYHKYTGR